MKRKKKKRGREKNCCNMKEVEATRRRVVYNPAGALRPPLAAARARWLHYEEDEAQVLSGGGGEVHCGVNGSGR